MPRPLSEVGERGGIPFGHYVDGALREPRGSEAIPAYHPPTSEELGHVAISTANELSDVIACARQAFESGAWPRVSVEERAQRLYDFAALIEERAQELAKLNALDTGKTLSGSLAETRVATATLRSAGSAAVALMGNSFGSDPALFELSLREPYGVVAGILAYNSPVVFFALKSAAALAAGNTVILKPSPLASSAALYLAGLSERAGIPPGVLNVICGGSDAAVGLAESAGIDLLSLTGSPAAATALIAASARHVKPTIMELGGKSANIVFDDAELDRAVSGALFGAYGSAGQRCFAGTRLLVHRSVFSQFVDRFTESAAALPVGDPFRRDTRIGSLISLEHTLSVEKRVEQAKSDGVSVLCGGRRPRGLESAPFFEPTLLGEVSNTMAIAREEVFGPVACILPFDDDDEAIALANDSDYGLVAGVWTRSLERGIRCSKALRVGRVWINSFGVGWQRLSFGGQKRSGFGREGGLHAVRHYSVEKGVTINLAGDTSPWT